MSTQGHESEAINVSGLKASLKKGGNIGIYNEAICSTAGGTAAKVTNTTPPSFTLTAGAKILVKFTYAISAENATLQVGSNSAKPIYYKGSALPADIVKAGTSLLLAYDGTNFNVVGDINTDTTYSVMGASGASHASGLVPDTPSVAGTTKYLREDGTWQEPAGQNYSAGDGIDISNNEISADNTIARKTDLAPAKLGSGIGTCSTSSGTALEVTLSDYNLVQNGIVAVTFANDVPANATLNINGKGAKPIIYKGAAIEADTIKADDTVMFCYDGTNYVVTSLGGGGGSIQLKETVIIDIVQENGYSEDLIGATIQVVNDDTSEVTHSTTWQGSPITIEINSSVHYTINVGSVTGYFTPSSQSYQALPTFTREVEFVYNCSVGVYVEATDGTLYSSTRWNAEIKRANSVVVLSENCNFRIALESGKYPCNIVNGMFGDGANYMTPIANLANARNDYNGASNTEKLMRYCTAHGCTTTDYAAPYATSYTFPDGVTKGYVPALGQLYTAWLNKTNVNACLTAAGGTILNPSTGYDGMHWSSTYCGLNNSGYDIIWERRFGDAEASDVNVYLNNDITVRVFGDYSI